MKKRLLLRGDSGSGFPLVIAVTLALVLVFCCVSEYLRVATLVKEVRDAVQESVISTVNDNYDDVYHAVREGYAAGYAPGESDGWTESMDSGNIYAQLAVVLGLTSTGDGYAKYADEKLVYSISDLNVTLSNNGLASGESKGYLADGSLTLTVPVSFAGEILPPLVIDLKVQAKYIPKF